MDLVVLLPTANRPDLLRTALASVARQACLDRVVQVVVSENGRNRDSERT
jgi:glycosyltransferase involved in cell wall biosynthesis